MPLKVPLTPVGFILLRRATRDARAVITYALMGEEVDAKQRAWITTIIISAM